jgi:2-dehydropantoate 2-reductase
MESAGKTWIVGAGGVGCVLGARMERAAPGSVTFVDAWPENVRTIQDGGLIVDYPDEQVHVRPRIAMVAELGALGDKPDLVVLAVKAYDTAAMLDAIVAHIGDAPILSLQNSINEERIAATVGEARTIGGICLYDGALVTPGRGRQTMAHGKIVIGELDGTTRVRTEQFADLLRTSTPVQITDNIWGELWTKLIRNVMVNAMAAVTGLGMGELVIVPGCDQICIGLGGEAVRVALQQGHRLKTADLFDCPYAYPADWYLQARESTERKRLEQSFHDSWVPHPNVYPSMLQDIRKGRRTEVEALNGYIVNKGRELNVPTPLNEALTQLVLEYGSTGTMPDRDMVTSTLLPLVR